MAKPSVVDLSARTVAGATFDVHVTPGASQSNLVLDDDGAIKVRVREVAEDGRATAAAAALLAAALGVAKSRVTLVRGAKSRTKTFRLD